jgi:integrase
MRGLVLVFRYSGMRIGDAVNLRTNQIEGNRLFLYTQKTGVPVNVILPEFVLKALEATPKVNEDFYFWTGIGETGKRRPKLANASPQTLQLASVPNGHRTASATLLQSNFSWQEYQLNESLCCWAIKVFASRRNTIRHGYVRGRINWKQT